MSDKDKNPWGRPPVFTNAEELENKITEYFEKWYRKKKINIWAENEFEIAAITTSDLALYLGFESRQSIYDYAKKDEYSYIIKKALFYIEREYEEKLLYSTNCTWAIFALKNMWWKDKTEVENKNTNVDITETLTDNQKKLIAKRILDGWNNANTSATK